MVSKENDQLKFEVSQIGEVINDYEEEIPEDYKEKVSVIEIFEDYEEGLLNIEKNSHLSVFCWFHKSERDVLQVKPLADDSNPLAGVFATRAPVRPNPIAETICELVKKEGKRLHVKGLDALNGTPVVDIKPYTSNYLVEDVIYPEWAPDREGDKDE